MKRINVLIKNMKGQNNEIKTLLKEIQDVRESTIKFVNEIQQVDVKVEEAVFKESKDKQVKQIYDEVQNLKGMFDTIIGNAQEENRLRTQIRDI